MVFGMAASKYTRNMVYYSDIPEKNCRKFAALTVIE